MSNKLKAIPYNSNEGLLMSDAIIRDRFNLSANLDLSNSDPQNHLTGVVNLSSVVNQDDGIVPVLNELHKFLFAIGYTWVDAVEVKAINSEGREIIWSSGV